MNQLTKSELFLIIYNHFTYNDVMSLREQNLCDFWYNATIEMLKKEI